MIIKAKKHTKINIKHPYEIWSVEIKKNVYMQKYQEN